ncbi:MAG: hypothetical protein GY702_12040 [Desulfobulbaceae bacterium]|nr:hypothetical protein [Desulfobulbaceae bacterium]
MRKLLIPIQGDFVAQRFDLAREIIIVTYDKNTIVGAPKTIIMNKASDEELCQMIVEENITDVVCGGIEEPHYNFLIWKKVTVLDSIIGGWQEAIDTMIAGTLKRGMILVSKHEERLIL